MHPVVIDRTFAYGDVKILVARDDEQRSFIAVNTGPRQRGDWAFLQVQPSTIADLEALRVDLHTVITHRRAGMVFTAPRHEVLQPHVWRRAQASIHPGRPG